MLLREAVGEARAMGVVVPPEYDFCFEVLILNNDDEVIGKFTDEEYTGSIAEIYKDWEVSDRCIDFDKERNAYVMTIRIREEGE